MKRLFPLCALLLLLTMGVCLAGCTSPAPATCPAPVVPVTSVPPSTGMDTNTSPRFLFVQESSSGTLEPVGNGTYTLTLDNVVPYTLYFSDRPTRIAGFTHMAYFISGFNWSVAPNAAISLPDATGSEDTLIVELSVPRYNTSARQLVYTTKVLNNYPGEKLAEFVAKADPSLPRNLGRVSLFIDSSPEISCAKESVQCSDGTCRSSRADCSAVNTCPSHSPFRCADGKCAVSSSLCPQIPG